MVLQQVKELVPSMRGRLIGHSLWISSILICLALRMVSYCRGPESTAESTTVEAAPVEVSREVRDFFIKHCYDCHANGVNEGGLDLEKLTAEMSERRPVALDAYFRSRLPGTDAPRHRAAAGAEREAGVSRVDRTPVEDRRPRQRETVQRRLNREAYQNTIRDLLAIDIELKTFFPRISRRAVLTTTARRSPFPPS